MVRPRTVKGAWVRRTWWPLRRASAEPACITSTSVPRRTRIVPVWASNEACAPAASERARSGRYALPSSVVTGGTSEARRWPSTLIVAGVERASTAEATREVAAVASSRLGSRRLTVDLMEIVRVLVGDDLLDLQTQLTQQFVLRVGPDEGPLAVDRPFALAAGDPDVGHLALAGAVHHAAHHGDLHRRAVLLGDRFDHPSQVDDLDLGAPARRAGGDLEALLPDPERLEDAPGDRVLLHGIGRQRDAQRVADALEEEYSEPDRRADRAVEGQPGLGHAQVERVGPSGFVQLLREEPVRVDRVDGVV